MEKQTAVEWLAEIIRFANKELYAEMFEEIKQAKRMEKEQIGNAILEELEEWGAPYLFEESTMNDWAEKRIKYITETKTK